MHWAARVAMGMMASYLSETTWEPIWFKRVASFWPLKDSTVMVMPFFSA